MNYLIQVLVKIFMELSFKLLSKIIRGLISLPLHFLRKSKKIEAKLLQIKDGDTFSFELQNGENINLRLFGIDTPEKFNSNKMDNDLRKQNHFFNKLLGKGVTKEEMIEAGNLATNFAKSLLSENSIYKIEITDRDKYGRYVGIVYFNETSTNVSSKTYNEEIIKQGYAKAYTTYIKNDFLKIKYSYYNLVSRINKNGLWASNKTIMSCL